jgi:hypothetical protein
VWSNIVSEPGTRSEFATRARRARERADNESDERIADAHREIAAGYDALARDASLDD